MATEILSKKLPKLRRSCESGSGIPTMVGNALFRSFFDRLGGNAPGAARAGRATIDPARWIYLMQQFTPSQLLDLYQLLTKEHQYQFLAMLGRCSIGEVPFVVASSLEPLELKRFADFVFEEMTWHFFPILEQEARRIARESPDISDEDFDRILHERVKASQKHYDRELSSLHEARLKEGRDRKSDPRTIARNVEICDLRSADAKQWSLKKLANKHGLSVRAITKILNEEPKWRRLASRLGTN